MKSSKRKSLLKESIYQLFLLSFCFIVLVGVVLAYNSFQSYQNQNNFLEKQFLGINNLEKSTQVQDEIKNIFNYLEYEYDDMFKYANNALEQQTNILKRIIEAKYNENDANLLANQLSFKSDTQLSYSVVLKNEIKKDAKDTRYIHLGDDKFLQISINPKYGNTAKVEHVLSNMEKFRVAKAGDFYVKVADEKITSNSCSFKHDDEFASYKCVDSLWNIEFGASYSLKQQKQDLQHKKEAMQKELTKQLFITLILVVLGLSSIIVFIKNKEKIIKDNIKNINQSLNSLDGNISNLKLNLNSNIKYEEFKFLNLALNKFIIRMKKTQELISEQNKQIMTTAYYDTVTGLKNPSKLLLDLQRYQHSNSKTLAVFFIDLDKFKQVNESKGRDTGDNILKYISNRLVSLTDKMFAYVSRLAADEFIVFCEFDRHSDVQQIDKFAHDVLDIISKPIHIDDDKFYLTASIGVAIYTSEYEKDYDKLIRSADSAMSIAKKKGANKIEFYDKTIDQEKQKLLKIQKDIRIALQENEFRLFLQPKVEIKNNKIVGAEALIRWVKNDKIIPPGYFIEVAENSDLIVDIGRWVIKESLRILKELIESNNPIKLSLNLSVKQLKSETLIDDISRAIKEYNIPPHLVELEITENFAIQDSDNIAKINELKSLGVGLSMDDFGTGYSSLAYLHNLPFDVVKIDMSFIINMSKDPKKQALVEAIVQMSKTLDKKTVAEGVEFQDDLDLLSKYGCDEFQGYFFSKPLPEKEFFELLTKGKND